MNITEKADMTGPIDRSRLKDRTVLITGGASGLGQGMVKEFAEAGAYVIIADVQKDNGERDAKALTDKGYHVRFIQTDVSSWDSQVKAFKAAVDFSPSKHIDVVVPCAGLLGKGLFGREADDTTPSLDSDPIQPDISVFQVNMMGAYYSMYLALYYFRTPEAASSLKSLVFIASMAAYIELEWVPEYNGTKYGIRGLSKALRASKDRFGVRQNLIAPWYVKTPMTKGMVQLEQVGIKTVGVEQVVDAVVRCAVDEGINNRAIGCFPEGNVDLRDDMEGMDAGEEVKKFVLEVYRQATEEVAKAKSEVPLE